MKTTIRYSESLLDRIVAMLTKLGQRGGTVQKEQAHYTAGIDPDTDSAPDADKDQKQTNRQPLASGED